MRYFPIIRHTVTVVVHAIATGEEAVRQRFTEAMPLVATATTA